jgi:hypothetical protein
MTILPMCELADDAISRREELARRRALLHSMLSRPLHNISVAMRSARVSRPPSTSIGTPDMDNQQLRTRRNGDHVPLPDTKVQPLVALTKPQMATFTRLAASRPGFWTAADLGNLTVAAISECRLMDALVSDPPTPAITLQRINRVYSEAIRELRLTPRSRASNTAKTPEPENEGEALIRTGARMSAAPWETRGN